MGWSQGLIIPGMDLDSEDELGDAFKKNPVFIASAATILFLGVILGVLLPGIGGGIVFLLVILGFIVLIFLWDKNIELPDHEKSHSEYPKSYTKSREYEGYNVTISVEEWIGGEHNKNIKRRVSATATDVDNTLVTEVDDTRTIGRVIQTTIDETVNAEELNHSRSDQTHDVVESVYDDIITYEATGSSEDTTELDSALDVVFGEKEP
ncbi:hypothetical protein [Halalkalicoccus tibetensis]|uniref:Uncharacterized protein n=1 Tax=Halalkalicoccus tibetensis TaxID=175632 RepID=A0ABD5V9S0_9EURY